jgi:hypothetical protein
MDLHFPTGTDSISTASGETILREEDSGEEMSEKAGLDKQICGKKIT